MNEKSWLSYQERGHKISILYRWSLTYPDLTQSFQFYNAIKQYAFCKRYASNFEFLYFPGLAICENLVHSVILGSSSKLQLLVSHMITRVNNQCIYSHSVPKQSFHFSLSAQYSINCMTYSTLYNKIGFMLDDLVQLQANEVS